MTPLASVVAALTFFLMPAPTILFDTELQPIVTLPTGYFVMRSGEDAPEGYIAVVYDDLSGLVRAADVRAVDYKPVTKYEKTVTFKCNNDGQPVNLRAAPEKSAQVLSVLESTATGRCYGYVTGDALIQGADTLWYYVNVGDVRGYCYYAHISVTPTPPNIIEKEPEPVEPDPSQDQKTGDSDAEAMPRTAAIILIVALCIPVPFVMFYLFRKPKKP